MQLKNNCISNSKVIAQGEANCYECKYSLITHKYMQLPTNHIALPMTLDLTLKIAVSFDRDSLTDPVALVLFCIVKVHLFSWLKWYLSIPKGYTASKLFRLYSFQPKRILLPHFIVTMHFSQCQCGTILFTGYVVACCTLMASVTMHFR